MSDMAVWLVMLLAEHGKADQLNYRRAAQGYNDPLILLLHFRHCCNLDLTSNSLWRLQLLLDHCLRSLGLIQTHSMQSCSVKSTILLKLVLVMRILKMMKKWMNMILDHNERETNLGENKIYKRWRSRRTKSYKSTGDVDFLPPL